MQKGANDKGWLILPLLFFYSSFSVFAQITDDSATVVSSGSNLHNTLPLPRSGKPFYDILLPSKEGFRPVLLFSSDDRFFAGVTYNHRGRGWRTDTAGQKHKAYLHYSFVQKAFSVGYQGVFNGVIGNWNLLAEANYDWVRWMNFYGLGNETKQQTSDNSFYRIRSREAVVGLGFYHRLGKQSSVTLTPFYQRIHLLNDQGSYFSQSIVAKAPDVYETKNFGGLRADILVRRIDDLLLPTKGVVFSGSITHTKNLNKARSFTNYSTGLRFYLPFLKRFVLSVENGAATVGGKPEFYQLNAIGGSNLRGYRRERFWGETAFYNNNEVYYLFEAPSKLFKGKMGMLLFSDQGRVWKEGEQSKAWHHGYG
ncbi:MAG TPA: hypothetical protein VM871_08275, partial [Flavisolibacter sp.]|nr:hypothetical protein [Flavisolibacter sp.]